MTDYGLIERRHLEALLRYIGPRSLVPGDFLRCVLSNDLSGAVSRADLGSQQALVAIVTWLYNRAPEACWGSPEKVAAWRGLSDRDFEEWRERALADTCLR